MSKVFNMKEIDLTLLHTNSIDKIEFNDDYSIPSEYYSDSDVLKLDPVHVEGFIRRKTDDIDYIDLDVNGIMYLEDSISLEEEKYPFSLKIEGNLEDFATNLENTLDIYQLLWENIVLEIPLKFTKVEDLSKFQGDGWKLVSEDEIKSSNNPFQELLKNKEEE